jgi:hypothetical protein
MSLPKLPNCGGSIKKQANRIFFLIKFNEMEKILASTVSKTENEKATGTGNDILKMAKVVSNSDLVAIRTENDQLLKAIWEMRENTSPMPANKLGKYAKLVHDDFMAEWAEQKQSVDGDEQMLEKAFELENQWACYRGCGCDMNILETITSGCRLVREILYYEEDKFGEVAQFIWSYTKWKLSQSIEFFSLKIKEILCAKKGLPIDNDVTASPLEILVALHEYFQGFDAARNSLNSEIIKMLKSLIKSRNVVC